MISITDKGKPLITMAFQKIIQFSTALLRTGLNQLPLILKRKDNISLYLTPLLREKLDLL